MIVFERIVQLLDENKVEYKVIEHEPVLTCEDAAKIRGTLSDQGAKSLICVADKKYVLIVLSCSSRLDFKLFKKWQGVKDLRLASPDEVFELTGLKVGSIPPIGLVLGGGYLKGAQGYPQGAPLQSAIHKGHTQGATHKGHTQLGTHKGHPYDGLSHREQPQEAQGAPLRTFVDEKLLEQEEICFNAGLYEKSILMRSDDYLRVVKPEVGRYT